MSKVKIRELNIALPLADPFTPGRIDERTFGWLTHHRRLVRDYETTITSAEAWVCVAMIRIQLRRLA